MNPEKAYKIFLYERLNLGKLKNEIKTIRQHEMHLKRLYSSLLVEELHLKSLLNQQVDDNDKSRIDFNIKSENDNEYIDIPVKVNANQLDLTIPNYFNDPYGECYESSEDDDDNDDYEDSK